MPKEQKLFWVYHVPCEFAWRAGPFKGRGEAEKFIKDKLMKGPHCPGCDEKIDPRDPTRGSYEIR